MNAESATAEAFAGSSGKMILLSTNSSRNQGMSFVLNAASVLGDQNHGPAAQI
jgi:hypothetical protein